MLPFGLRVARSDNNRQLGAFIGRRAGKSLGLNDDDDEEQVGASRTSHGAHLLTPSGVLCASQLRAAAVAPTSAARRPLARAGCGAFMGNANTHTHSMRLCASRADDVEFIVVVDVEFLVSLFEFQPKRRAL